MSRVLVVAPHPDDEVLGAGGFMARLSDEGHEVHVAIVTKGYPPQFDEALVATGRKEAAEAHAALGVSETYFLDFPAAGLDTVPHRDVNMALVALTEELLPETILLPFSGDLHLDHQLVSHSVMVAARPNRPQSVSRMLAYETVSETNWNSPMEPRFTPNVFVGISSYIETKLQATACFASQIRPFPHERSLEAIRALATVRGSSVGLRAAEGFMLIRWIADEGQNPSAEIL